MQNHDIRWRQRFQNFSRAFELLRDVFAEREVDAFSLLEKDGIIQRFEYTFELGWKVLKDYLEYSGIMPDEATPRKVIRECATHGIFASAGIDPEIYLNMMLEKNALSHTYDYERFLQALVRIKEQYLNQLELQHKFLASKELEIDG